MSDKVNGLITSASPFGPGETVDRLESAIGSRGFTLFTRIDHSALAAGVQLTLRSTILIAFGNPRAGTSLMQESQTIGIDLPLKFLVWVDDSTQTLISYNDPLWLAERHGVTAHLNVANTMKTLLQEIVAETTGDV